MADVRRELGTIERIRWPILGAISNGDILYGSLGQLGYYQGNPLAWMDGLHYLRQSIDFEFLLQMELLLPEAALNM